MTERDKASLRARALREQEAAASRADGGPRTEGPGHDLWQPYRFRRWRTFCLIAAAMIVAGTGIPAMVSAYGEFQDEPPAIEEEETLLLPGWEVYENPAASAGGYARQPRGLAEDPFGPDFREYAGPDYVEDWEPPAAVPDEAPEDAAVEAEAEVLVMPRTVDGSGGQERVIADTGGYREVVSRPAEDYSAAIARMQEYPVAAQVYDTLKGWGWSDVCIAGVLGNMMAECGGQTLALEPYDNTTEDGIRYYGLCQWSMLYNADVDGRDVAGQLAYLAGNIEKNMGYFGGSPSTYWNWLGSTDAGQAARDFCRYYERGAGLDRRAKNAGIAYEWILSAYD